MKISVFDPHPARENLLPLTYTRPVGDLRIGISTLREKWEAFLPGEYSWRTEPYLSELYPGEDPDDPDIISVAGNIIADADLADTVGRLEKGEALYSGGRIIARRGREMSRIEYCGQVTAIDMLYDIFIKNGEAISRDFQVSTAARSSGSLSGTDMLIGPAENVFIEEGAVIEGVTINTKGGPVYIGRNAEVMEGSCLRGPVAICDNAVVNMGTKIYGATTIGPFCKVGGELNNVVMWGYSNKAHDGFLGNAVIGQWCNIGAGCVASNLKNDYTEIKLWNYPEHRFLRTGLQFCGPIMGDHTKCGINTMLNTATVLGVGVNIHGSGFPRPFVASFSEGSVAGFSDVPMSKFIATARRMMARRNIGLTDADQRMFDAIREIAENYK